MRFLKCDDEYCTCPAHVDVDEYIACCPSCHAPLVKPDSPARAGMGMCLRWWHKRPCHEGGFVRPRFWAWLHRDVFDGHDLIEYRSYEPPPIPEELLQ